MKGVFFFECCEGCIVGFLVFVVLGWIWVGVGSGRVIRDFWE